jgi:hypothetical protein
VRLRPFRRLRIGRAALELRGEGGLRHLQTRMLGAPRFTRNDRGELRQAQLRGLDLHPQEVDALGRRLLGRPLLRGDLLAGTAPGTVAVPTIEIAPVTHRSSPRTRPPRGLFPGCRVARKTTRADPVNRKSGRSQSIRPVLVG